MRNLRLQRCHLFLQRGHVVAVAFTTGGRAMRGGLGHARWRVHWRTWCEFAAGSTSAASSASIACTKWPCGGPADGCSCCSLNRLPALGLRRVLGVQF